MLRTLITRQVTHLLYYDSHITIYLSKGFGTNSKFVAKSARHYFNFCALVTSIIGKLQSFLLEELGVIFNFPPYRINVLGTAWIVPRESTVSCAHLKAQNDINPLVNIVHKIPAISKSPTDSL